MRYKILKPSEPIYHGSVRLRNIRFLIEKYQHLLDRYLTAEKRLPPSQQYYAECMDRYNNTYYKFMKPDTPLSIPYNDIVTLIFLLVKMGDEIYDITQLDFLDDIFRNWIEWLHHERNYKLEEDFFSIMKLPVQFFSPEEKVAKLYGQNSIFQFEFKNEMKFFDLDDLKTRRLVGQRYFSSWKSYDEKDIVYYIEDSVDVARASILTAWIYAICGPEKPGPRISKSELYRYDNKDKLRSRPLFEAREFFRKDIVNYPILYNSILREYGNFDKFFQHQKTISDICYFLDALVEEELVSNREENPLYKSLPMLKELLGLKNPLQFVHEVLTTKYWGDYVAKLEVFLRKNYFRYFAKDILSPAGIWGMVFYYDNRYSTYPVDTLLVLTLTDAVIDDVDGWFCSSPAPEYAIFRPEERGRLKPLYIEDRESIDL